MYKPIILLIVLLFFACENKNNATLSENSTQTRNDSTKHLNRISDSLEMQKGRENSRENSALLPILKTVFVTSKEDIRYYEKPDSKSKVLGAFEQGTKLGIVEYANSTSRGEKWVKVVSWTDKSNNYDVGDKPNYLGYTTLDFLTDSSRINFLELPVDFQSYYGIAPEHFNFTKKEVPLDLNFSKLDKARFEEYKKLYSHKIISDAPMKRQAGDFFSIQTKKSRFKFRSKGTRQYVYVGYVDTLKAHIIGKHSDQIYTQFLIDEKNGILNLDEYYMDILGGPDIIRVSPKSSRILTAMSCSESDQKEYKLCRNRIVLYELNQNQLSDIKVAKIYCGSKWEIADLIWIDENSFALEVGDEILTDSRGNKIKNRRYFKVTIQ